MITLCAIPTDEYSGELWTKVPSVNFCMLTEIYFSRKKTVTLNLFYIVTGSATCCTHHLRNSWFSYLVIWWLFFVFKKNYKNYEFDYLSDCLIPPLENGCYYVYAPRFIILDIIVNFLWRNIAVVTNAAPMSISIYV